MQEQQPTENQSVRFRHFHSENGRRLVATAATSNIDDNTIAVGFSRCHSSDHGSRKEGRRLATARLNLILAGGDRAETLIARGLGKIMSREEFIEDCIKQNPFA